MRWGSLALVMMLLGCYIVDAQDATQMVAEAEVAYAAGDYSTAITLYESILAAGGRSGALYFNLGSAYYRSGDLGQAQLNLRRAQQYIPRDGDLNQVMLVIQQERIDVQGDSVILIDRTAMLTASLLTRYEMSVLVFALWVGVVCVGIALFLRPDWQRSLLPFLVVLSVGVIAMAGLWGNRAFVDHYRPLGVMEVETTFYSGPSREYLELFQLSPAAELRIVEQQNGWGRASLPGGQQGWVSLDQVLFVQER